MSQPPPIQPDLIPYASAPRRRPGILTAIMIISIVLGSLSILANLCGILQPLSLVMMRSLPTPTTGPSANPFANLSLVPAIASSAISILNLALGAYLLFAGILIANQKPASYRHHWRWALLKVPVALIGSLANGWMQYELQNSVFASMPQTAGQGFPIQLWVAVISALFTLMLSLTYPVALMIVLSRPLIRTHFENLGTP